MESLELHLCRTCYSMELSIAGSQDGAWALRSIFLRRCDFELFYGGAISHSFPSARLHDYFPFRSHKSITGLVWSCLVVKFIHLFFLLLLLLLHATMAFFKRKRLLAIYCHQKMYRFWVIFSNVLTRIRAQATLIDVHKVLFGFIIDDWVQDQEICRDNVNVSFKTLIMNDYRLILLIVFLF